MRQSGHESGQLSVRRGQKCEPDGDAVVSFLRQLYPKKTAEFVEADTDVSARTVRKWLDRGSSPSFPAIMKLFAAYGPALLMVAFGRNPPDWASRAAKAERQAEVEARLAHAAAELEEMRRAD